MIKVEVNQKTRTFHLHTLFIVFFSYWVEKLFEGFKKSWGEHIKTNFAALKNYINILLYLFQAEWNNNDRKQ